MANRTALLHIDAGLLAGWPLPEPAREGDKEERGRMLVIAGSGEMPGAAWLAAVASLRAGAGKLQVATAASVAPGLALRLPEARVVALPETSSGGLAMSGLDRLEPLLEKTDAVVIGPGLQDETATRLFTRNLLARAPGTARFVIDAQAMNVVADVAAFERPPLLTPHAGEMAHLTGFDKAQVSADPERAAREAAERWNAVVALKGAVTFIAAPDGRAWRHEGGSIGLATSGSGDVLAGIVGGLAARGAPLEQAAAWGVALHALAGVALAERLGPLGFLASELAAEVPRLMHRMAREGER
jgi:ADP-dependent NAD(P)H-hydrate dehydratase